VFWGDETDLPSDDVRGRGFAPRGFDTSSIALVLHEFRPKRRLTI
jgi:hypothetical protein